MEYRRDGGPVETGYLAPNFVLARVARVPRSEKETLSKACLGESNFVLHDSFDWSILQMGWVMMLPDDGEMHGSCVSLADCALDSVKVVEPYRSLFRDHAYSRKAPLRSGCTTCTRQAQLCRAGFSAGVSRPLPRFSEGKLRRGLLHHSSTGELGLWHAADSTCLGFRSGDGWKTGDAKLEMRRGASCVHLPRQLQLANPSPLFCYK